MEPIILFDIDSVKYAQSAVIQKKDKETGLIKVEPVFHAYHTVSKIIKRICKVLNSTKLEVFLTQIGDKTNFRSLLYKDYKANRRNQEKPIMLQQVHDYIKNKYKAIEAIGEEADDLVSIRQYELNSLGFRKDVKNSIIVSIDKDLDNIPGWHYNYKKQVLYYVTELQAKRHFYLQILTGDRSDNVPRLYKGWQQKLAEEQINKLQTEQELKEYVYKYALEIYKTKYNVSDEQVKNNIDFRGKLLHMRTKPNEIWSYHEH